MTSQAAKNTIVIIGEGARSFLTCVLIVRKILLPGSVLVITYIRWNIYNSDRKRHFLRSQPASYIGEKTASSHYKSRV